MLTISFYSYKGGAGRTLSVYYVAKYLSEIGKKVVVADFDFEAPGIPYKFHKSEEKACEGMVDYAHHFYTTGYLPELISPYSYEHQIAEGPKAIPLRILPAGKIFEPSYWNKLSQIDWKIMLFGNPLVKEKPAMGNLFFLEWKERVREAFESDVLLIDSRTGINDLTSVTLNLLADQVIVLGAHNSENLDGSRLIMEALRNVEKLDFKEKPVVHFVLTRLPKPSPDFSEEEEKALVEKAKERLNRDSGLVSGPLVAEVMVVHSDDRILIDEGRLTSDPRDSFWKIERDYFALIMAVFQGSELLGQKEIDFLKIEATKRDLLKTINSQIDLRDRSPQAVRRQPPTFDFSSMLVISVALLALFSITSNAGSLKRKPVRPPITDRELEVLRMLADGASPEEVAQKLHIQIATVHAYKASLRKKLSDESVNELMQTIPADI
jgi:DNA-binding CsgD family transcriptional regulator/cellulose biosynthesis protein BcsQ